MPSICGLTVLNKVPILKLKHFWGMPHYFYNPKVPSNTTWLSQKSWIRPCKVLNSHNSTFFSLVFLKIEPSSNVSETSFETSAKLQKLHYADDLRP